MNTEMPLLSIVIPTRNRSEYVKCAIQSILRNSNPAIQLVIEDNSDSNQLEAWLNETISDRRLVYRYSAKPASMSENYDRAMGVATGEYVCLIGDDDSVSPEVVLATKWAKENDLDAVVPASPINYVWPDLHMKSHNSMAAGELCIRSFSCKFTFPKPDSEIQKCILDAGQNFHRLPKAYYGIVRKRCFDLVKNRCGTYFPGVSPDMAAALSIASFAKRVCHVDYPLFVPGSSARSNAGLSGLQKHIGWLRDQPHLPATCEQDWSEIVPAFYSVQTIWAETAVGALRAVGRGGCLTSFNVPWLYAFCVMFHFRYMKSTIGGFYRALRALDQGYVVGSIRFVYWFCYWFVLRAKSLMMRLTKMSYKDTSYRKSGVRDIDCAVQSVSEYLEKSNYEFSKIAAAVSLPIDDVAYTAEPGPRT